MASILIRTVIVYVFLSVVLKVLGKRQVGELEVTELVSTLILSEVAALPLSDPDIPLLYAAVPILILLSIEISLTFLKNKSALLKRIFESRPNFLINKGQLCQDELSRVRISLDELIGELRLKGVSDINEVYYAILEQNGQLSVILKKENEPATPKMLGIKTGEDGIAHPLILDGNVCRDNLRRMNKSEEWLGDECKKKKCRIDEVFLCTLDDAGSLTIIKRKKT